MYRERALKIILVAVGLLFTAGIYPLVGSLLHPADSDSGDTMMLSLLRCARNLPAHGSAESICALEPDCFCGMVELRHAVAMSISGLEIASQRVGFLIGSAVLVVIGVALIALAPTKQEMERASAVVV